MNVTLKNKTGQAIPILLDHPVFRHRKYGFRRRPQTVIDQAKDGSRSPRIVQREEPGSVTLPPRGEISGLHPAIKNCRQVRGLLSQGRVAIVPDKAGATPPPPAPRKRATRTTTSEKGAGE